MLSKIPIELKNLKVEDIDKEILRTALIAELDAVNLYEQLAEMTDKDIIKKVFLSIAKEEKTHIGEFQALLLEKDKEQERELKNGEKEMREIHSP